MLRPYMRFIKFSSRQSLEFWLSVRLHASVVLFRQVEPNVINLRDKQMIVNK